MRTVALLGVLSLAVSAGGLGETGVEVAGVVRVSDRPVAGAVVWLEGPGLPGPDRDRRVVLDQRNLSFVPRVLVVQVGTSVELPNNDRVLHNVFSFRDGKQFDVGLYPVGTMRRVMFDQAGVSRIFCNIHPNMAAYVVAVDSPYFGITDTAGRFSIPAVRAGEYTYHAWRPGAEPLTGSTLVDGPATLEIRWP